MKVETFTPDNVMKPIRALQPHRKGWAIHLDLRHGWRGSNYGLAGWARRICTSKADPGVLSGRIMVLTALQKVRKSRPRQWADLFKSFLYESFAMEFESRQRKLADCSSPVYSSTNHE